MLPGLAAPSLLWTRAERLRGWQRALQFAPTRLTLGVLLLAPASALEIFGARMHGASARAALATALTVTFAGSLFVYARVVERRPALEVGVRSGVTEWASGFAVGVALLAAVVGILCALGAYRVQGGGSARAILDGLVFFTPHALLEEVLFRALLFKIAEESLGTWAALAIEGAFFGAAHLGNPHATWGGALAIAVEAGALLTAAFLVTRRMWLVWGIHVGWNLAQGSLFGIRVSGGPLVASWLTSAPEGPDALSGGAFGVEASPVAVAVCLTAALALFYVAMRRGQIVRWADTRRRRQEVRAEREAWRAASRAQAAPPQPTPGAG